MTTAFRDIRPRARVRYLTPQGDEREARAQRLLIFSTHVVCDAGGGRPVVVDAYNYVRHENPPEEARR